MKFGDKTAIEMLVVELRLPEVPVTVTDVIPRLAVVLAVRVSSLLPVVGFVSQDAATPSGRADVTARVTLPVNPA
jgi:hypothetical protein